MTACRDRAGRSRSGRGRSSLSGGLRVSILAALLLAASVQPPEAGAAPQDGDAAGAGRESRSPEKGAEGRRVSRRPNILFLLADQWRAQTMGYAGDPVVRTPHLDRLAQEGIVFTEAVSGCPVCCPYRATLMTGQRPLTHGVFMNDVPLRDECVTLAEVFAEAGYDTGYIGKWHLDGRGRSSFTPPERRQGFRYWKALECTHEYNRSPYYADDDVKRIWEGYDAFAQTRDAREYLRAHARGEKPFFLFVAWGPPHDPYPTAPAEYRALYSPAAIQLRPNVPEELRERARKDAVGYYAHCSALDACVGELRAALREHGIEDDTLLVFTSDHGDLLGSHGAWNKQQPWEESIRVPLIFHHPARFGRSGRKVDALINAEDLMPTLLGLCGLPIPPSVEGLDFTAAMEGGADPSGGATLITCPQPFGQWTRRAGGREYRGLRTRTHTYVRDRGGSWLLFDNRKDPFQLRNLVGNPEQASIQTELDALLRKRLSETRDEFLPGGEYLEKWGYRVGPNETVPYTE